MTRGVWTDGRALGFTDYWLAIKGGSLLTAIRYCAVAAAFFTWAEAEGLPIVPGTVEAWLRHLWESGCKENSTRAGRLAGLRTVCAWMVTHGYLASDPTDGVPSPRFSTRAAQIFSADTLRKLFAAPDITTPIGIRDRAILLLFYGTGMRRAEMTGLFMDHMMLGANTGRCMVMGKGNKQRQISFEGPPVLALKSWIVARLSLGYGERVPVFVSLNGRTPGAALGFNGLRQVLMRAAKTAGVKSERVFLHKLRSTYATHLYESGIPVNEISLLMGHSCELTTWRYVAISERHLRKARLPLSRWREVA